MARTTRNVSSAVNFGFDPRPRAAAHPLGTNGERYDLGSRLARSFATSEPTSSRETGGWRTHAAHDLAVASEDAIGPSNDW
jgi:hypothetical protein